VLWYKAKDGDCSVTFCAVV